MESGLFGYWEKQELEKLRYTKCEAKNLIKRTVQQNTPINLFDLLCAFVILGIGILLSACVFIAEFIIGKMLHTNIF